MKKSIGGVVLCLLLAACARSGAPGSSPVSERIGAQLGSGAVKSDSVEYVARFDSGAEASAHVASLEVDLTAKLASPITAELDLDPNPRLVRGQLLPLTFALAEGRTLAESPVGRIELTTAAGKKIGAELR